jgi:hypothetical protein
MISYRLVILSSGVPQSTVKDMLGIVISNLDNDYDVSFSLPRNKFITIFLSNLPCLNHPMSWSLRIRNLANPF